VQVAVGAHAGEQARAAVGVRGPEVGSCGEVVAHQLHRWTVPIQGRRCEHRTSPVTGRADRRRAANFFADRCRESAVGAAPGANAATMAAPKRKEVIHGAARHRCGTVHGRRAGAAHIPQPARLAYIGKDGTPRVIPVGFFWTGDQFVISSATTSPKVTALSARPDVALVIDASNTPDQARARSIRGRASVEIVDGVVEEYLAAARKPWTPKRRPSSSRTAARCTTSRRESRSRRTGCAATTSAPAECHNFLQDLVERNQP
jgi:hypothetical protein